MSQTDNIQPVSRNAASAAAKDAAAEAASPEVERLAEDPLIEHMLRQPTEEDFADVLTPEGDSGDIVGSDVSDSTTVSNASIAGTG